jgi:HEAT repeat protein
LARIGADSADVKQSLVQALRDPDAKARVHIAKAVLDIDPSNSAAMIAVVEGLQSDNEETRLKALLTVRDFPDPAAVPLEALVSVLRLGSDEEKKIAVDAICRCGERAIMPLVDVLEGPELSSHVFAAVALDRIGIPSRKACDGLLRRIHRVEEYETAAREEHDFALDVAEATFVCALAAVAVPGLVDAIPVFSEGMKHENEKVRRLSAEGLAKVKRRSGAQKDHATH